MWKKDETTNDPDAGAKAAAEARRPDRQPARAHAPAPATPASPAAPVGEPAAIGPSITIRGEVSGDEDLLIQGTVEGSVDLGRHAVSVGPEGRVKADINGRIVTVEGSVEGDLRADEQIVLRPSAEVVGDLTAPRVVLENGARFRGMVDMGEGESGKDDAKTSAATKDRSATAKKDDDSKTRSAASSAGGSSDKGAAGASRGDGGDGKSGAAGAKTESGGSTKDREKVAGEVR